MKQIQMKIMRNTERKTAKAPAPTPKIKCYGDFFAYSFSLEEKTTTF